MEDFKVLLVDDEEEFVAALVERLSIRGIYAEGASTGEDAISKIYETEFNVVLLDLKMPGMSGLDVMENIKSINPSVKIILITGYGSIQIGEEGLEKGAYHYFTKPINIDDLIDKIKEAVNG